MNLETKIIIYKFTPQVFTLTREERYKNLILHFRQNAFTIVTDSD